MMFIIGILLFLFGFAMAVAGFIGIIFPKLLKDRKTGAIQTRGFWAKSLALGLAMFVGGSLLMVDDDDAKQTAADTQTETRPADDSASNPTSEKGYDLTINTPKKELPISFEELRQRINSQMARFDYPKTKPIPKNAQPTGEKDSVNLVYQHTASESLSMIISASPENKKPRGILILAAPSATGDGAELLGLFGKSIAILTAPISDDAAKSKELSAKLLKMSVKLAEDFNKNPEEQAKDSYTEDGITYGIAITPGMPVMFNLSLDE
ncbi:hypothetical protein HMPREF3022_08300 [Neisseria sp. HMSC065C04]|uniref:hypothetical protein n=1 Tax=Neisseria sp. HMSC065C04 TaxID=1739524 RepID=UPI0008A312E9|nr:hypothetical protein [Neisseria sp. HMSC065C04]OFO68219.1 hypothetical protein HMPREF3022_08300 [Neisseria sp. HMSC065C04]